MAERPPAVIVGAGPAGAALAYVLAARGAPVTLIERQHDFAREFRGEGLMPSGVSALAQCGLGDLLDQVPHATPDTLELYRDGRLAIRLNAAEALPAGDRALTVSQPHLLEAIVARASEHPSFTFVRGSAVRELMRDALGRVRGVRFDTERGPREMSARLVIGADGRSSVVRRRGGFSVHKLGTPLDVVWAKLPWPACYGSERPVRGYLGHAHLLIALPAPDGLLQIAWVIRKGSFGALRSRGPEQWVQAMAAHVSPDLAEHLRTHAGQITRPFLLDAETDRVVGWARRGALLLGDAAHTMSPVGAQGLNVALRDAVVAANHLVEPLRDGADAATLDAAAGRIEAERGPEIDAIQALAARPPQLVMGTFPGAELVRALVIAFVRTGIGRRAAARVAAQLLHGVREVKLTV